MHILRTIRGTAGGFGRNQGGNFAMVFAVVAPAILMSAGYGLNMAQLYNVKSGLNQALDSAVTSTARDLTTGRIAMKDARDTVEAFLVANSSGGFASAERVTLDRLVVDSVNNTVEASASAEVAVAFPVFGTGNTQRVAVESAALYSDRSIEVVMMLDVTGSMAPDNKLRDLKRAAASAVSTFLDGQDEANPRVRVALAPFANSVNAGALAGSSVFVETEAGHRGQAPSNEDPRMIDASSAPRPDNCATERKGDYRYSDAGPQVSMVNRDLLLSEFAEQSRTRACPKIPVQPLTADAESLHDAIDGLRAEGGTAGHIGIQWSWYLLSPEWKSVLDRKAHPAGYRRNVAKYAILMTDGEFNLSYADASGVSKVYDDRGKAAPRDAAKKLCAEMRGKGIEIFTIGFKLRERNAKETMRDCASPDSGSVRHYFETESGAELTAAYQEIAANIERLAITR